MAMSLEGVDSASVLGRIEIPEDARQQISERLTPGSSLIIADTSVDSAILPEGDDFLVWSDNPSAESQPLKPEQANFRPAKPKEAVFKPAKPKEAVRSRARAAPAYDETNYLRAPRISGPRFFSAGNMVATERSPRSRLTDATLSWNKLTSGRKQFPTIGCRP
jgi:hypothetical protein